MALVPLPSATTVPGVMALPEQARLRSDSGGFVGQLLARDGEQVRAGQRVARLEDPALLAQQREPRSQLSALQARQYGSLLRDPREAGAQAMQDIEMTASGQGLEAVAHLVKQKALVAECEKQPSDGVHKYWTPSEIRAELWKTMKGLAELELRENQHYKEHKAKHEEQKRVFELFRQTMANEVGDIHKLQYLDRERRVAYPGSTIQQNYGEAPGKGFLFWEIESRDVYRSTFHEVPHLHPYVTVEWAGDVASTVAACLPHPDGARFRIRKKVGVSNAEMKQLFGELLSENIRRFGAGEPLLNVVDRAAGY